MSFFFTDGDLAGSGQFSEDEIALATEFTVPSGGSAAFRWRTPVILPSGTPVIRVWDSGGNQIATRTFDSALSSDSWAVAGAANRLSLAGGTYRVSVNANRYAAVTGFFAAPVTRGEVVGLRGMFSVNPTGLPNQGSTAAYLVDIDWQADDDPDPEPEPEPEEPTVVEPRVGAAMRLAKVMDEVALALQTITGLRMYAYPKGDLRPGDKGAGYVSYPARVVYNQAYQRGEAAYEGIPITLLTANPWQKAARDRVAAWADADSTTSVISRLEEWPWASCDDLTVEFGAFEIETIGGIDYLALTLQADAIGPGRD